MELFWGKAAFCRLNEEMCSKNTGLEGGATGALQGGSASLLSAFLSLEGVVLEIFF